MKKTPMMTDNRGIAALELAIVLPILCMMLFAIIDIGMLVDSRLIITNLSREGANLLSRDLKGGTDLLSYLTSSSSPLDMVNSGKIYATTISSGQTSQSPDPVITSQVSTGNLSVSSGISSDAPQMGLPVAMYNHLVFNPTNHVADILGVSVVEVFYQYTPITPLASFAPGLLVTRQVILSRAVFCTSGGT